VNLSKKTKIIISTVAVIFLIILAVVGFFMFNNKPYEEKSELGFAMGSVVTVKTFGSDKQGVEKNIIDGISRLDTEILTAKTDSSLVGRINKGDRVKADGIFLSILNDTLNIYSKTNGKAAVTVGTLSSLWDFDSGKEQIPSDGQIKAALKKTDDKKIRIDGENVFASSGVRLDLGSVGKGAACDLAANMLNDSRIDNAVVAVGGSIFAKGETKKGKKINVGIRNPFGNENDYFGYISTDYAFVSTSGNYEKVFEKDGKTYHHLLDCTTGYPVENELTGVTVICDNGAKSDALSTACFVMGFNGETLSLLKENGAKAIFVFKDKSVKIDSGLSDIFTLTDNGFSVSEYEA